jgi:hypothetical protein
MREVIHYERREQNLTACRLCPKLCSIREGKYGFCGVRQNRGGEMITTVSALLFFNLRPSSRRASRVFCTSSDSLRPTSGTATGGCGQIPQKTTDKISSPLP